MKTQLTECAYGLLVWQVLAAVCKAEYTLQTLRDVIGADNSTHYKLKKAGSVRIILTSVQGDADVYVSGDTLQPDYNAYNLKAASCGVDIVDIPEDMSRPVGITVYGHISADVSKYVLEIIVFDDPTFDSTMGTFAGHQSSTGHFTNAKKDEEESIFSTILVGILKIILDILL